MAQKRTYIKDLIRSIRKPEILQELYDFAVDHEIYGLIEALQEIIIFRCGDDQLKDFFLQAKETAIMDGYEEQTAEEMFAELQIGMVRHLYQFGSYYKIKKLTQAAMWEILRRTESYHNGRLYRQY